MLFTPSKLLGYFGFRSLYLTQCFAEQLSNAHVLVLFYSTFRNMHQKAFLCWNLGIKLRLKDLVPLWEQTKKTAVNISAVLQSCLSVLTNSGVVAPTARSLSRNLRQWWGKRYRCNSGVFGSRCSGNYEPHSWKSEEGSQLLLHLLHSHICDVEVEKKFFRSISGCNYFFEKDPKQDFIKNGFKKTVLAV